eukprot:gene26407-31908_t
MLPAGLNYQQRFADLEATSSVLCYDNSSNNVVATILVKKASPSSIFLECNGLDSKEITLPLAELVAKLCLVSTNATSIHAIDATTKTQISLNMSILEPDSKDEIIDWVSTEKDVLLPLPRRIVYQHLLLHRGFGAILLRSKTNEIFVHKRSRTKKVFPSMLDMFIGGVSLHKEPVLTTLVRELEEEVGIDLTALPKSAISEQSAYTRDFPQDSSVVAYIGTQTIRTNMNHAVVDCFIVRLSEEQASQIQFKDGEIESGEWMSMGRLLELVEGDGEKLFVPDGMQVWRELPSMLTKASGLSKSLLDKVFTRNQ